MKPSSRWMAATIGVVVASMMFGAFEPMAFAQEARENTAPERAAAQTSPEKPLPSRPLFLANPVPPVDRVAQAVSQSGKAGMTTPQTRTSYVPPARQSSGKSKKWIWIVAAAAGAGITAAILAGGDDDKPTATIEIGNPLVGEPQ